MSQAEDLLVTISESTVDHTHEVTDSDTYFVIDPITREVENTARKKNVLMQYDHDSERFTFEVARYVEGHDMSLCNQVKVHYNNVDSTTGQENADVNDLIDLQVDPNNEENVICSWLISRQATQLVGILSFLVQYICTADDGTVIYEWHSDIYSDIEIRAGRNNGEAAVIEYTDILEQWRARLFGAGDSVIAEINSLSEEQQAAIKTTGAEQIDVVNATGEENVAAVNDKGVEVLATIPKDYQTTYNMAEEAQRTKGDAIVESKEGTVIVLDDAAEDPLQQLKLFGKTTQDSTTGKNLFDISAVNANSYTILEDRIRVNGWAAALNLDCISLLQPNTTYWCKTTAKMINKITDDSYTLFSDNVLILLYRDTTHELGGVQETLYEGKLASNNQSYTSIKSFTTPDDFTGCHVLAYSERYLDSDGNAIFSTVDFCNIMITDSEATLEPYEPFTGGKASPNPDYPQDLVSLGDDGDIGVEMYGKNLFDFYCEGTSLTNAECEINENSVTVITSVDNMLSRMTYPVNYPLNVPLAISFDAAMLQGYDFMTNNVMSVYMRKGSSIYGHIRLEPDEQKRSYSIILPNGIPETGYSLWLYIKTSAEYIGTVQMKFENIQVEVGEEATEYEEHKEVQTLTANTPNGLPGIAVSSGGNYTDKNGQQWICDEIDLERGVYIQRIGKLIIDGNENWEESTDYDGYYRYVYSSIGKIYGDLGYRLQMNTHFFNRTTETHGGYEYLYLQTTTSGGNAYIQSDRFTTVDELKTWLGENNVTVIYELIEPIETELTATEIEAYKALRTNKLVTTIQNDSEAYMNVSYNVDTRTFILRSGVNTVTTHEITLPTANWTESDDGMYYTQAIDVTVRESSKVDLQPTPQQLIDLITDGISMFVANENGNVTAYAIGGKPSSDLTIQATETVVIYV